MEKVPTSSDSILDKPDDGLRKFTWPFQSNR